MRCPKCKSKYFYSSHPFHHGERTCTNCGWMWLPEIKVVMSDNLASLLDDKRSTQLYHAKRSKRA